MNEYPPYMLDLTTINHKYVAESYLSLFEGSKLSVNTNKETKEIFICKGEKIIVPAENYINFFVQGMCGTESTIQGQKEVLNYIMCKTIITKEDLDELDKIRKD